MVASSSGEAAIPVILIVAGPNGAGKTTFATRWINDSAPDFAFVNADEVARELPPGLSPAERDMRAGRLMLARLDALITARADLVLETTLSSRLYARRIPDWRAAGYDVELVYVRLPDVETSIARVAHRVRLGGHGVPEPDLRRRFGRSLANLELHKPLVDRWQVWDSRPDETILADSEPAMKSRLDPKTIAKAMKAAAVVAKTGTREERSGKFIAPKAKAAMLTSAKHAAR